MRRSLLCRAVVIAAMAALTALLPVRGARADTMRDFVVSCSYGVLAGTLVGAATLAFSDRPGENLNRVARGASLGLYAGMLLGAYVVFGGPSEDEDVVEQLNQTVERGTLLPKSLPKINRKELQPSRLAIFPLIGERGLEGAAGRLVVMHF